MATVSLNSGYITNRDASPRVISNSIISKGVLLEAVGTLESTAADDIGSKYRLCSVPSNARISAVSLSCDSTGTAGAADVGIYQNTENGSAVVDADFFASAQLLTTALNKQDVTHESGVYNIDDMEKPLWQALGLTSDPKRDYDVVLTLTAATVSAATITLQVRYVI